MNSAKAIPGGLMGIRQLFASGRARIRPKTAANPPDSSISPIPAKEDHFLRLRREILGVQRKSLIDLFKRGAICSDVYSRLLHELDVEETNLKPSRLNLA